MLKMGMKFIRLLLLSTLFHQELEPDPNLQKSTDFTFHLIQRDGTLVIFFGIFGILGSVKKFLVSQGVSFDENKLKLKLKMFIHI